MTKITEGIKAREIQVLCWIQSNPREVRSTNASKMARVMNIQGISTGSIAALINDLQRRGVLKKIGNKWHARYIINYTSPNCPEAIKLRATPTEKQATKDFLEHKKPGDTITPEGVIVHPTKPVALEKPKAKKRVSSEEEPKKPKVITIPLEKDGKNVIINININIY